ncbi:MAG: hypothetical protein ACRBN8_19360 [Nannocystales bacterium]
MSRAIQVPDLPSINGDEVEEFGRIRQLSGAVSVFELPGSGSRTVANLRFNDRVFVILRLRSPAGWLMVSTDDGAVGYVDQSKVSVGAPEPNAVLHYVRPGETAQQIARQHFSEGVERGRDERFYVNVLVHANWSDAGEARGVYRARLDGPWDSTQTRANYLIWVPSVEFANTLEGQVSAGSFRRDLWNAVVRTASEAWEWVKFSAGFIGGLIHGALECVWDMIVGIFDLVGMVWDFIKVLIAGELLTRARALWDSLSLSAIQQAATGLFEEFVAKWNHDSALRRGHFRGWVVGYLIATVLLTIFTLGAAALALTGRIGMIIRWARSVRVLSRAMDAAQVSARRLGAAGRRARDTLRESLRRPRSQPSRSPAHADLNDELRAANGGDGPDAPRTGVGAEAELRSPGDSLFGRFVRGQHLTIVSRRGALFGGNTIRLSRTKTTTIVGTLDDTNTVARRGLTPDGDINGITLMGDNPGGINILRSPRWQQLQQTHHALRQVDEAQFWRRVTDEFFTTVNRPWLQEAIRRGDAIRLVSNPADDVAIYVTTRTGEFVLNGGQRVRSIFGREVQFLQQNGYRIGTDGVAVRR